MKMNASKFVSCVGSERLGVGVEEGGNGDGDIIAVDIE